MSHDNETSLANLVTRQSAALKKLREDKELLFQAASVVVDEESPIGCPCGGAHAVCKLRAILATMEVR